MKEIVHLVLKRKILILVLFLLSFAFSFLAYSYSQKIYQADSMLKIGKTIYNTPIENNQELIIAFQKEFLLYEIAKKLSLPIREFKNLKMKIKLQDMGDFLKVSAFGDTPEEAVLISSATAFAIIERHENLSNRVYLNKRKLYIKEQVSILDSEIASLKEKINTIKTRNPAILFPMLNVLESKETRKSQLELVWLDQEQSAMIPETIMELSPKSPQYPVRPRLLIHFFLAIIIGVSLSVLMIFLIEFFRNRMEV